jgi:hypothetical protein
LNLNKTLPKRTISSIEYAHVLPYHARDVRAHGFRVHLHGYEYGLSGRPRAYADEHVHENGREHVSGNADGMNKISMLVFMNIRMGMRM